MSLHNQTPEHEHRYKDLIDNDEEKPPSLFKKILMGIAGILLVILFLSYFGVGNRLIPILEGRLVSTTVGDDFVANLSHGGKVVFERSVYEKLLEKYFAEQEHEFSVCLLGYKQGKDYLITGFATTETFHQSFANVISEQCPPTTIIPLHTHPYKHCIFSEQDIRSYEAFLKVNPDAITGLMCEPDRFTFHGHNT